MNDSIFIDTVIIGAGILGLSIAYHLSKKFPHKNIAILEKHSVFGFETSSRNSEVIHAGIYYKKESLKLRYCNQGREILYDLCKKNNIQYKKCGKYIVINNKNQMNDLQKIMENSFINGISLEFRDKNDLINIKNLSHFYAAIWSAESGILDSHSLMKNLVNFLNQNNVTIAYKNFFLNLIDVSKDSYLIQACDESKNNYKISCRTFINAAGLSSGEIASLFFSNDNYKIKPCRGRYFSLNQKYIHYFQNLIYPIPDPNGGLGIHITFDLNGKLKLGPDVDWSFSETHHPNDPSLYKLYDEDFLTKNKFYEKGKMIIPSLLQEDISIDYIGVRPKLFIKNKLYEDFLIEENRENDLLSIHLLGIESPGLTSALAIGKDISLKISD